MGNYFSKHKAYSLLKLYWAKLHEIQPEHWDWLTQNGIAYTLRKDQILYHEGDKQKNIYFVSMGLLGRQTLDEKKKKRQLLSIATPNRALFTTSHMYSNTPTKGDIITLRPSMIIEIPYQRLQEARKQDMAMEVLADTLLNKKKAMLDQLRLLSFIDEPINRYLAFTQYLPELLPILTQAEQADLLHISTRTIQRGIKML